MGPVIEMGFWETAVSIFFVFNALGQIPVFVSVLTKIDHARQKKIIVRELIVALIVILAFIFFGPKILKALSISSATIGIGGGLLLILIGLDLIFPKMHEAITKKDVPPGHHQEPMIIPLAIPGLAGPGTIAAVMIFATQVGPFISAAAFVVAWIPSLLLLLAASYIKKLLGDKGLLAVEKLGGMLLTLIGIEMLVKGVVEIVKLNFS